MFGESSGARLWPILIVLIRFLFKLLRSLSLSFYRLSRYFFGSGKEKKRNEMNEKIVNTIYLHNKIHPIANISHINIKLWQCTTVSPLEKPSNFDILVECSPLIFSISSLP